MLRARLKPARKRRGFSPSFRNPLGCAGSWTSSRWSCIRRVSCTSAWTSWHASCVVPRAPCTAWRKAAKSCSILPCASGAPGCGTTVGTPRTKPTGGQAGSKATAGHPCSRCGAATPRLRSGRTSNVPRGRAIMLEHQKLRIDGLEALVRMGGESDSVRDVNPRLLAELMLRCMALMIDPSSPAPSGCLSRTRWTSGTGSSSTASSRLPRSILPRSATCPRSGRALARADFPAGATDLRRGLIPGLRRASRA